MKKHKAKRDGLGLEFKTFKSGIIRVVSTILLGTAPVNAANMDRPLNDRPTVTTEIVRGSNTAFDCGSAFVSSPAKQQHCILNALRDEQEHHADYRPFQLGVFYGGFLQFDAEVRAAKQLAKVNRHAAKNLPMAKEIQSSMFTGLRALQKELHVSDYELIKACGDQGPGAAELLRTMKLWEDRRP